MLDRLFALAVFAALLCAGCAAPRPAADASAKSDVPALLPAPAQLELRSGRFTLRDGAPLVVVGDDPRAQAIARAFAERLERTRGLRLELRDGAAADAPGAIVFALTPTSTPTPTPTPESLPGGAPAATSASPEAYEIDVDAQRMRLQAADPRGLFYAGVSAWQLLTQDTAKASAIEVPALRIADAPRFVWRGAMLDSARHYQSPEFIKRFIDQLALLKLNTFHWHLTDDQGWRIEIRRYPRLTDVGAWRRPAGAAGTDASGQPVRYGGYYTQAQIRDIVRYAADRAITIVPEIDVPGHMQAAIAAYPELGSAGDVPRVSPDWGVHSYLLNVDERTLTFLENVFDEVLELFPGTYVHVGGDEAVKDQWKASPRVQARLRELGVKDEERLQGWVIARLQRYLAAHGRRLIGWDEILEGGLPPDATVMSWRGAQGGIDAARSGHDVVMAPSPDLYLNHLQSDAGDEPPGRGEVHTLADIYAFQPMPQGIDATAVRHVLGAQGNLWTEHMRTTAMVEHAAFPRLAALAEVLWSPPATHDWHGFVARLVPQMRRWQALGIDAAESAFEVRIDAEETESGRVAAALRSQVPLPIRYTLDGSAPVASSPRYEKPLALPLGANLRAATFLGAERAGPVATQALSRERLLTRGGEALAQCSGKLLLRVEDDAPAAGPRAAFDVDLFDPCWRWPQAPLDGIAGIAVEVGALPYNYQLSHDIVNVVPRPPRASAHGELRVRLDSCDGAELARLPLDAAAANPALTWLEAPLPPTQGRHDLCLLFSDSGDGALWAISQVALRPR
jgi:hexosaminidase